MSGNDSTQAITLVQATLNELTDDRNKWRKLALKLATSQIVTAIILVFLVVAVIFFRQTFFFATSPTGTITPLVPLNKPTVTSVAVQRFAVRTVSQAFSLNFRHWRNQLSVVEPDFTPNGYKSFLAELERTGWLKTIEQGLFTATAIEIARPVLVSEGLGPNGVYGYVVEAPMTLTLENPTERRRQELKARIVVVRVPSNEKVDGIAVDKVFVS